MANRRFLETVIDNTLRPFSWEKKKDHWYSITDDLVSLLHLSKSAFGGQFQILLGVFIRPDGADEHVRTDPDFQSFHEYLNKFYSFDASFSVGSYPQQHHCDIRANLEQMVPDRGSLAASLNLEHSGLSDDERAATITKSICDQVVPLFLRLRTLDDLVELYSLNIFEKPSWVIPTRIRNFLEGRRTN